MPRENLPASSGEVDRRPFSLVARARGFGYAWRGLVYLATTQHNAWIHLAVAALVIAAAVHFRIDRWELAWLILAIGLVLAAEAMNTAVEVLADTLAPDFNPGIGRAKDVAAGAVLILALTAALIGILVFLPHLLSY